jgi:Cytochrome P450.
MERLNGPYGMYATVYGISTKVVHVAHPVPAKAMLTDQYSISKPDKHTSISESLGAIKSPAYDHFKNFSGDGVFTADGSTWKAKRTSVLHCLLKGCTKDDSQESQRLEEEANIAADGFISNATKDRTIDGVVNVVPLLQRATIGLIYRFITHHNVSVRDERVNNKGETNIGSHNQLGDIDNAASDGSDTCTSESALESISNSSLQTKALDNDGNFQNPFHAISSYLEAITNIRMIILAQSRSIWFLLPRWMYRTFSSMYREEEKQMVAIRQFARAACKNAQPGSPLQMLRFKASHNPDMSKE